MAADRLRRAREEVPERLGRVQRVLLREEMTAVDGSALYVLGEVAPHRQRPAPRPRTRSRAAPGRSTAPAWGA